LVSRRKSYNVAQRRKIFEEANGICWRCGLKIDTLKEEWHVGHVGVAHAFGGDKVAPEHKSCNMKDCYEVVIPAVAKSNQVWSKRNERRKSRSPMLGSKQSNMKRCVDGRVIDRRTGREWGT
jgi:5-methylcytosine-specific restriction endonuclease McrA